MPNSSDDSGRPIIELRNLSKQFGPQEILRDITLLVRAGETLVLIGESGCGKSVTMKLMMGLMAPSSGDVQWDGVSIVGRSDEELVRDRLRFGYLFQGAALFDSMNVYENIAFGLRQNTKMSEKLMRETVFERIKDVGLTPSSAHMMPSELSGGMKKRVGLARAMALMPDIILYDEPTTGLDPANSRRIGQLILRLPSELNVTPVVVTHEIELCLAVSDRIVLLDRGQLRIEANVEEFRSSTAPEVLAFLGKSDDPRERSLAGREGESHAG